MSLETPSHVAPDPAVCTAISQFLALEAKLLDENRYEEWLALLDEDIDYHVPIRVSDDRPDRQSAANRYRLRDNMMLLSKRVERMTTGQAWAESPASRTVRVVGSVLVTPTDLPGRFEVDSAVLIYRQRALDEEADIIPVRRQDVVLHEDGRCRLLKRTALLPWIALRTPNLAIFL
ncbi:hypothetical protein BH11PSE5_BH11PSE5_06020 [soil metagenome]